MTRKHPYVVLSAGFRSPQGEGAIAIRVKKEITCETEAQARQLFGRTDLAAWLETQRSTSESGEIVICGTKVLNRFDEHGKEEEVEREELRVE